MPNSFKILLTLACGIGVLVAVALFWLGPRLAYLAFVDGRSDQPYFIAEFVRSEDDQVATYSRQLQALVEAEEGNLGRIYRVEHLSKGSSADEWSHLVPYQMTKAQNFVQIVTSSPYRDLLANAPEFAKMRLGSYVDLDFNQWRDTLVVWLISHREDASFDVLWTLREMVELGSGRIVLDAPAQMLAGAPDDDADAWQQVLILDFADSDAAHNWLNLEQITIERDVANSKARDIAVITLNRSR